MYDLDLIILTDLTLVLCFTLGLHLVIHYIFVF